MTPYALFTGRTHSSFPARIMYNAESGGDRKDIDPAVAAFERAGMVAPNELAAARVDAARKMDAVVAQAPESPDATHTVAGGDSLWKIAKDKLGDPQRWKEIAELNNLEDPNKLKIGQVLKMPKKDADAAIVAAPAQTAEAAAPTGSFADMLKQSLDTNTLRPAEKVDITLPSEALKGGFAGAMAESFKQTADLHSTSRNGSVDITLPSETAAANLPPVAEAGHTDAVDVHGNAMV